jgi:hypothetical protein
MPSMGRECCVSCKKKSNNSMVQGSSRVTSQYEASRVRESKVICVRVCVCMYMYAYMLVLLRCSQKNRHVCI